MTTYLPYRGNTYCNLGHVIDGQFADTYLQQAGLIFCRGSMRLAGIVRPDVGTVVSFAYTRDNVKAARIPRVLRVLSSFADPFTNVTTVQLGCKLTMLQENRKPDTKVTPEDSNPTLPPGWENYVAPPVSALSVANQCLTALGITAAATLPLQNQFTADFIDISEGYVSVLAKLLESETYVGWLNENEQLQVRSLTETDQALGPVINNTNCFTLSPIGVGELPAEEVTVAYSPLSLRDATLNSSSFLSNSLNTITYGFPVLLYIPYERPNGFSGVVTVDYIPVLTSETKFDNERKPILTTTTTTKAFSAANPTYVSQFLSSPGPGVTANLNAPVTAKSETTTSYDKEGRVRIETTKDTLSPVELAGSLGLNYVFPSGSVWSPGISGQVTAQLAITEYTYLPNSVKREVKRYQNWCLTQSAQYLISSVYDTAEAASAFFSSLVSPLIFTGAETTIRDTEPQVSKLPGPAELAEKALGTSNRDSETVSEFVYGASNAVRTAFYTLPYTGDDYFTRSGDVWIRVGTAEKAKMRALNYGRVQNRLRLGNSQGVSIQVPVELLPTAPFDALYLQAGGLTGQYRANGMSWTFDQNGIVGQVDALFWLAIGQDASPGPVWFPVAPGVTVLPTTPGVTVNTTPAPANSASVPAGWNPAAPDLGALFGALPTGVASVFPTTLDVAVGLEPFNETVEVEAIGRAVFEIEDLPYSLTPQEAEMDLVGASVFVMEEIRYVAPPTAGFRLTPQAPFAYVPVQMSAAQFRLVPQAPEVTGSAYVEGARARFRLIPQVPIIEASGRVNAPAVVYSFSPEVPTVTGDESSGPTLETILFLEMQGTNGSTTFVDSSSYDHQITAHGNAQISGNELLLDGVGDYLLTEQSETLKLGTKYFRIEGEFMYNLKRTDGGAEDFAIVTSSQGSGSLVPRLTAFVRPASNVFEFYFAYDYEDANELFFYEFYWYGEDAYVAPGVKVAFALVRDENGTSLELNGVRLQTDSEGEYYTESYNLLGEQYIIGSELNGTIDNFKILAAPDP